MLRTDGFISEDFRSREGKASSYGLPLQPSRVGVQGCEEEGGEGCGSMQGGGRGQAWRVREGSPGAGGLRRWTGHWRAIWGHLVFLGRHALEFGWRRKQFQSLDGKGVGGGEADLLSLSYNLRRSGVGLDRRMEGSGDNPDFWTGALSLEMQMNGSLFCPRLPGTFIAPPHVELGERL